MTQDTAAVFASLLVRDWRKTYGKQRPCTLYTAAAGVYDSRKMTDADIVRYRVRQYKTHPGLFWYFLRRVSTWCGHGNKYRDFIDTAKDYMTTNFPDVPALDIPA